MNGSVKVLGIAVGIWAGAAMADSPMGSTTRRETKQETNNLASDADAAAQPSQPASPPVGQEAPPPPPAQDGAATATSASPDSADQGTGGSGSATAAPGTTTTKTTSEETQSLDNVPPTDSQAPPSADGTPGSGPTHVRTMNRTTTTEYSHTEPPPQPAPVAKVDEKDEKKDEKKGPHLRGVQVMLGGGVEGYTGSLASRVRPGGAYGATVAFKPTSVLGLEIGYTGAVNELRGGGGVKGADIVRNGVQGVATFGLAATAVQPYVLAGIGINRYNARTPAGSGFRDDTSGNIPLGAGVRSYIGPVAIDARVMWNVLFANNFATGAADNSAVGGTGFTTSGGRYLGMISAGANF